VYSTRMNRPHRIVNVENSGGTRDYTGSGAMSSDESEDYDEFAAGYDIGLSGYSLLAHPGQNECLTQIQYD
jgi:hypothetical protein